MGIKGKLSSPESRNAGRGREFLGVGMGVATVAVLVSSAGGGAEEPASASGVGVGATGCPEDIRAWRAIPARSCSHSPTPSCANRFWPVAPHIHHTAPAAPLGFGASLRPSAPQRARSGTFLGSFRCTRAPCFPGDCSDFSGGGYPLASQDDTRYHDLRYSTVA